MSITSSKYASRGYTVQVVTSTPYSAQEFELLLVNTSGSAKTINFPNFPKDGDMIWVYDAYRNADNFNITCAGILYNIAGNATYIIKNSNQLTLFTFSSATNDWIVTILNSSQEFLTADSSGIYLTSRSSGRSLQFQYYNGATYEAMLKCFPDGGVELYYNNSKKLETTSSGASVTGSLTVSSSASVAGLTTSAAISGTTLSLSSSANIAGAASVGSLSISSSGNISNLNADYLDGLHSSSFATSAFNTIAISGSNSVVAISPTQTITFVPSGNVSIVGDNSAKTITISSGGGSSSVTTPSSAVSGDIVVFNGTSGSSFSDSGISAANIVRKDANSIIADNIYTYWGTGSDLAFHHNGTNSYIGNQTGQLNITQYNNTNALSFLYYNGSTNENMITATPNGAVNLYYDNNLSFYTTTSGTTTNGYEYATSGFKMPDNGYFYAGDSNDLQITHNGTNSTLQNITGQFILRQSQNTNNFLVLYHNGSSDENMIAAIPNGAVNLYYDNALKLATTSTGVDITGALTVNGSAFTGGASKWTDLTPTTDFATTAPSGGSTITMNSDKTGTIKTGMGIRYKLSGTYYYAICTAITSGLLTIAGAPTSTTAAALTEVAYSLLPVEVWRLPLPGYWGPATTTTGFQDIHNYPLTWLAQPAYLVQIRAYSRLADSHTTSKERINILKSGNLVSTNNTNNGLEIGSNATWYNTVVDINTGNYGVVRNNGIEIKVQGNGGNKDSSDAVVELTWVYA